MSEFGKVSRKDGGRDDGFGGHGGERVPSLGGRNRIIRLDREEEEEEEYEREK